MKGCTTACRLDVRGGDGLPLLGLSFEPSEKVVVHMDGQGVKVHRAGLYREKEELVALRFSHVREFGYQNGLFYLNFGGICYKFSQIVPWKMRRIRKILDGIYATDSRPPDNRDFLN